MKNKTIATVTTFYHFSKTGNRESILEKGLAAKSPIIRNSRIVDGIPMEASNGHVFAFHEELNRNWLNGGLLRRDGIKKLFQSLGSKLDLYKIQLIGHDDIVVLDASKFLFTEIMGLRGATSKNILAYWNSKVLLSDYLGDYEFPECAIPFDVEKSNLNLIETDISTLEFLQKIGAFSLG